MSTSRQLLQHAVKTAAAGVDAVRRPRDGIVVLAYHRVGGNTPVEVDLDAAVFADQMSLLEGHVIPIGDALDVLAGARSHTIDRSVVVTFDDGTADFVDVALPILVRHKIPVTLFAATDFIDSRRRFPHDGTPLSWAELQDACTTGLVDVGSHTHTHRLLDRLTPGEVAMDLDRSIDVIEQHLGRPPLDFAYPKAVLGGVETRAEISARFRSAAVAGTRPNLIGRTDPQRLSRSPVQRSDGMRWFKRKAAGGLQLEDQLRELLNRRRYASVST